MSEQIERLQHTIALTSRLHGALQTGLCVRGDRCPYAHNVFEYWLHPTRHGSSPIPVNPRQILHARHVHSSPSLPMAQISCPPHSEPLRCFRRIFGKVCNALLMVRRVPRRYRSQLCNDGPKCRRKVCFFAHTIDELRVPPSKPFVAPDMLVGSSETEAAEPQVHTSLMLIRCDRYLECWTCPSILLVNLGCR